MIHNIELINVLTDNYDYLLRYAAAIIKNMHDAKDVLQEVSIKLVYKNTNTNEVDLPISYIRRIIRNTAIDYIHRNNKVLPIEHNALLNVIDEIYSDSLSINIEEIIYYYFSSYSQNLRNAFYMHYVEKIPIHIIAYDLGITPNHLSQKFRRMRKRLLFVPKQNSK